MNSAKPSEAPARILAVDDEENVRSVYRKTLTNAGYHGQTAASGEEGLRLLEQEKFDLIILDLKMPGMDGVEFMKRWWRLKSRPEVLVISGYATLENAVEVMRLGASDVAQKPCLSGDLLARVERILAHRSEPVVEYIRANFATIRSREEVASYHHISERTVSNRVRDKVGQPFGDFLRTCRIQEAQELLTVTDLKIEKIAISVGFKTVQAFSRAFGQTMGCAPRLYRKNHIEQKKS